MLYRLYNIRSYNCTIYITRAIFIKCVLQVYNYNTQHTILYYNIIFYLYMKYFPNILVSMSFV